MKKIIIIIFVFLVLISNVFAYGNQFNRQLNYEDYYSKDNLSSETIRTMNQFREKNQYNFSQYDEVEVKEMTNNNTRMISKNKVRFLFFEVDAISTIDIDEQGVIQTQNTNFFQKLLERKLIKQISE